MRATSYSVEVLSRVTSLNKVDEDDDDDDDDD